MWISRWLSRRRETRKKRRQDKHTAEALIEARAKQVVMVAALEGITPGALEDALNLIAQTSSLSADQALALAESLGLAGVRSLVRGSDDE